MSALPPFLGLDESVMIECISIDESLGLLSCAGAMISD
jgi:hypothetical protein